MPPGRNPLRIFSSTGSEAYVMENVFSINVLICPRFTASVTVYDFSAMWSTNRSAASAALRTSPFFPLIQNTACGRARSTHPAWSSDSAPVRAARSLPAPDRPPAAPLAAAAKIPPPASRFSAGSPSAPPASASRTIGARRDSGVANSTKPCAPAVTDERR